MTKVWMNENLLAYRQEMKETLRQVIQHNYVGGMPEGYRQEAPLCQENLLPPPVILYLGLEAYTGKEDDFIGVSTSSDFGVHCMHVTILDQQGNLIESGEMFPFPNDPTLWDFLPEVPVPSGTEVTVQVTAMDCMGSFGIWREKKIME